MGAEASTLADVENWTTELVASKILPGIGKSFAAYGQAITENGINGRMLLTLQASDLVEMGVSNNFHRRRLLDEIELLICDVLL